MSASVDISNFEFKPTDGVPATWTPAHTTLVYKSLKADPIRHDTDGWGRVHIRWVTKAIWFCDKIRRLSKVTGTPYHVLASQRVNVVRHLRPLLAQHGTPSLQYFAKRSPSFRKQLYGMIGVEWKGSADPPSSDDETSEEEEEGLSGKSGEDSGDWGSDDDGDHEEEESEVQEDSMDVDGEDSGSATGNMNAAGAAPMVNKAKGYTKTGWPVSLNQRLRQGKTQPSMRRNMEELEEEGHLEESEWKCDRCRGAGGRLCRVPKDSDNGHPACAECLISSHSCPNRVAGGSPAQIRPARVAKGKQRAVSTRPSRKRVVVEIPQRVVGSRDVEAGSSSAPTIGNLEADFNVYRSARRVPRRPAGNDPTTDFAFRLVERRGHSRDMAWDRIVTLSEQFVSIHRALQYELDNYGPFSEAEVARLLETRRRISSRGISFS